MAKKNIITYSIGRQYRIKLRGKRRAKGRISLYLDEYLGEMRIHYAGFVHPGFGLDRKDGKLGTPLIFEVRGHNVNVILADNERLAKLIFYRMSEIEKTDMMSYNDQELNLSKIFTDY